MPLRCRTDPLPGDLDELRVLAMRKVIHMSMTALVAFLGADSPEEEDSPTALQFRPRHTISETELLLPGRPVLPSFENGDERGEDGSVVLGHDVGRGK